MSRRRATPAHDALRADAQGTLADSYRLQFENDRVKVIRVHYPAGPLGYCSGIEFSVSRRISSAIARANPRGGRRALLQG